MCKRTLFFSLFLVMILMAKTTFAQEALEARPSPMAVAIMKFEDTYVKIIYGRPHKKEREIFGGLVPYGQVWRTGANEATEITSTKDFKIGGKNLSAGTYSLFSIPQKDNWTIIINSGLGQWGAYQYNQELDIMRFEVAAEQTQVSYEPFTIEFIKEAENTNLLLMWDKTKVSIPIEFL